MPAPIRLCVVGAGPAGLCALRYLTERLETFQVTAFERTGVIGGTWAYTEDTGVDKHGIPVHSSMYYTLTTNFPKEVMAFPNFPFDKDLPSSLERQAVLTYLQDYVQHFDIEKYIKFETYVECIKPDTSKAGKLVWKVKVKPLSVNSSKTEYEFDAVMVCNGHYSDPYIPDIPGIETFTGRLLHSHDYRRPEVFNDESVACLGGRASAHDIAQQLVPHVERVYLSMNETTHLLPEIPANLYWKRGILSIDGNTITFKDNSQAEVDTLILCTGYKFSFPFFPDKTFLPEETDSRDSVLYKHAIHAKYPSLSIIGLANGLNPFPFFSCQIRYVIAVLEDSLQLPSEAHMLSEIQTETQECIDECSKSITEAVRAKTYHYMGLKQYQYCDDMAELVGFKKLPKVCKAIVLRLKLENTNDQLKKANIVILNDEEFAVIPAIER